MPAPCSLVLEVYEEDGETVAWEVGTDASHPNPYLALPENYATQEVDFVTGAATIGQVEVVVIDRAQVRGDQASGWMTERLVEDGVPVIRDRRCRLLRYISEELGSMVIVDGPAGPPRLHESFAGYRWVIRDPRENERKIRAFTRADAWVLPMGLPDGFGAYVDEDDGDSWLVPPVSPITGTYRTDTDDGKGRVILDGYWADAFHVNTRGERYPDTEVVTDRAVELAKGVVERLEVSPVMVGGTRLWAWDDIEVLWRPASSSDPWTRVSTIDFARTERTESMVRYIGPNGEGRIPGNPLVGPASATYAEADGVRIFAAYSIMIRGHANIFGTLQDGDFPTHGQSVEIALRYRGEPTDAIPLHIEGITTGELLRRLYDGEYSDPDPETGDPVPSGVRYDPAALVLMTDPVRAVITEPVDDLRAWAETNVYAPTGWAPTLDADLRISPASQVPPDSFDLVPVVHDGNAHPTPEWNAGEFRVNALRFTYDRLFRSPTSEAAEAVNRLARQEVEVRFQSVGATTRQEESVEYAGTIFSAVGEAVGTDYAARLADERRLYVFDRYNYGAQTIQVPVRRAEAATWKPGDWVVVDVSWIPDYILRRRGGLWGGQIMSVEDLNCAWRVLLIEEAVPLTRPPES